MKTFDAIVIGAGQAGPPMAGRLTAAGKTVAMIERHLFGGTCVNTGCTPTKTLIASAAAIHTARRGGDYGFTIDAPLTVDMKRVKARTDQIAGNSRNNVEKWLRGMERCTVIQGHARFSGPKTVTVNGEELTAPLIFINVGGRARLPDMPGVRSVEDAEQQLDAQAGRRCRATLWWSAGAISAWNSHRCTAASAPR